MAACCAKGAAMSIAPNRQAEAQRRYRQRRNAEQLVLRCPAAHDTILDLS
jgi:hypothetical protein